VRSTVTALLGFAGATPMAITAQEQHREQKPAAEALENTPGSLGASSQSCKQQAFSISEVKARLQALRSKMFLDLSTFKSWSLNLLKYIKGLLQPQEEGELHVMCGGVFATPS